MFDYRIGGCASKTLIPRDPVPSTLNPELWTLNLNPQDPPVRLAKSR